MTNSRESQERIAGQSKGGAIERATSWYVKEAKSTSTSLGIGIGTGALSYVGFGALAAAGFLSGGLVPIAAIGAGLLAGNIARRRK